MLSLERISSTHTQYTVKGVYDTEVEWWTECEQVYEVSFAGETAVDEERLPSFLWCTCTYTCTNRPSGCQRLLFLVDEDILSDLIPKTLTWQFELFCQSENSKPAN